MAVPEGLHRETSTTQAPEFAPHQTAGDGPSGRAILCTVLGLVLAAVGVHFLLLKPSSADVADLLASRTISVHRVTIGQTFFLGGCLFLAAAWRPRS